MQEEKTTKPSPATPEIDRLREATVARDRPAIVRALELLASNHPDDWPRMLMSLNEELGDELGRLMMYHVIIQDDAGGGARVVFGIIEGRGSA